MWWVGLVGASDVADVARIESECLLERFGALFPPAALDAFAAPVLQPRWAAVVAEGETEHSALYAVDQNETLTGYARCGRSVDLALEADGEITEFEIRPHRRGDGDTLPMLLEACRRRLRALGCARAGMWFDVDGPYGTVLQTGDARPAATRAVERYGLAVVQQALVWTI